MNKTINQIKGKRHLGRMSDGRMPASTCPLKEEMNDALEKRWISLVHLQKLDIELYKLKFPINFLFLRKF